MERILVHDYCGHPFQVGLSRALARRGYTVRHAFTSSVPSPRGQMAKTREDPASFDVRPIVLSRMIRKTSYPERWRLERECGRKLVREVRDFRPDMVLSGNTPLDPQGMEACKV